MSRIFAAVTVVALALVGTAAMSASYEANNVSNSTAPAHDLMPMVATGLDITALVPIVLLVGLALAAAGVLSGV